MNHSTSLQVTKLYGIKPNLESIQPIADCFSLPTPMMKALVETLNSATRKGTHADRPIVEKAMEIDSMLVKKETNGFINQVEVFLRRYLDRLNTMNKLSRIKYNDASTSESILERVNKLFVLLALNGIISIHNAIVMTSDSTQFITQV